MQAMDETDLGRDQLVAAIAEQAPDAMIFADREGAIRFWNRAAERLFGYSKAEALGQRVIENIFCLGARISQVSKTDPSRRLSNEGWFAPEMSVTVEQNTETPEWTYSGRLEDINRSEPDPALFKVPEGYIVTEVPLPQNKR